MEARWRAAGHATELRLWPEAPHGFVSLPMTVADVALAAEHDFLNRTLGFVRRTAPSGRSVSYRVLPVVGAPCDLFASAKFLIRVSYRPTATS